MKQTITATIDAWATSCYGLNALVAALKEGDGPSIVDGLGYSKHDMQTQGWTKVGKAEITVTVEAENDLVANAVESLRAQQMKLRADAEMQATQIEEQIQNLLAITYERT